jgi:hypothetical protein
MIAHAALFRYARCFFDVTFGLRHKGAEEVEQQALIPSGRSAVGHRDAVHSLEEGNTILEAR